VEMQVVDCLPTVIARIDDDAIAAIELMVTGEVCGDRHQMSEQRLMLRYGLGLGGDVLFGNDEQMRGRLGVDVGKADA
jgi:hypothetical protein